jgi:hypothetical protein
MYIRSSFLFSQIEIVINMDPVRYCTDLTKVRGVSRV